MNIGITGMAMKASLGDDLATCYTALCQGKDGNAPLRAFDADKYNTKRSYEIDDRIGGADRPYRASEWLGEVIARAAAEAGLVQDVRRCGIFIGTGLRELRSVELWHNDCLSIDLSHLHFGPSASGRIPVKAPVYTLCNACSAANFALGMGLDMLQTDQIDVALVGGVDSITESMFGLLDRVNPMHPQALRSLNKDRRGVVMGEGAAAVVLERDPAEPKVWLRSVGESCDAYQDTAPDQAGLVAAMRDAGQRAGIAPEAIDMLFVHGTGTLLNDEVEMRAVREYFGAHAAHLSITGVKPNIGHTSGASGLISTIIASQSLLEGQAPPIFALHDPIEEAAGLRLLERPHAMGDIRHIQVNAFGFGGVNAVVILARS